MKQTLGLVSLVVRDYDEALAFYVGKLGLHAGRRQFRARAEQALGGHRTAGRRGAGSQTTAGARVQPGAVSRIGNQTGGRVFLFLYTDDFWRDFNAYQARGIEFVREPSEAPHGTVAVFKDLYGTLWDLVQLKQGAGKGAG